MLALIAPLLLVPVQDVSLEERLLAEIPAGVEIEGTPLIGPDGNEWPNVHPIHWSPDGTQVAYVGITAGGTAPVIGEEVGEPWMFCGSPSFGATGEDVLFRIGRRTSKKSEEWWVLVNGEKIGHEDWIGTPTFSPDGNKIAWWSQPGAKIVSDGSYDRSGQKLIVAERQGKKWKIGKGKKKWQDAMSLGALTFSADSKVVATTAMDKGKWFVITSNGRKEIELTKGSPMVSGFALAPDGKSAAACVFDSGGTPGGLPGAPPGMAGIPPGMKGKVVYGKKEYGKRYDQATEPVISPNGKLVAMVVIKGRKQGIAINDEKIDCEYEAVSPGVFRPDGKEIAYAAALEKNKTAIVTRATKGRRKSVRGPEFLEIKSLVWSADGERLAYIARSAEGWHVVGGDLKSEAYDEVGPPRFAGESIAFGARTGRELWWKVLALD